MDHNGAGIGEGQRVVQSTRPDARATEYDPDVLARGTRGDSTMDPDVLLDVPSLKVSSVKLQLDELTAHLALKAEILDLVKLSVGVDAHLGEVDLDIEGVEAQALLKVRLDHVVGMLDRALTTIDRNPELLASVSRMVEDVGGGTKTALEGVGSGAQHALREVAGGDEPGGADRPQGGLLGMATGLVSDVTRTAVGGIGAAVGAIRGR